MVDKTKYDIKSAFIRMQTAASKVGTYSRQAAYREANCLKTVKFEDEDNRISGSMEVLDEKCVINKRRQCASNCNCASCQSKRYVQSERKQAIDLHLRKTIDRLWGETARQNTIKREAEYQKTVRLLDLCNRQKEKEKEGS